MILAETIQFTPEQERALFLALLLFLALVALVVVGYVVSIVAGLRCGADPRRHVARVYWLLWVALEGLLAIVALVERSMSGLAIAATMATFTVGAERFGALVLRRRDVRPAPTPPEVNPPASRDRGAPGSRP